jgi:hypothetical protein
MSKGPYHSHLLRGSCLQEEGGRAHYREHCGYHFRL